LTKNIPRNPVAMPARYKQKGPECLRSPGLGENDKIIVNFLPSPDERAPRLLQGDHEQNSLCPSVWATTFRGNM
jgi:hypothetical protein